MKKRSIFLIISTFILIIIGVAFFTNIEKQKKCNEMRQLYGVQTTYKILSVDLNTMHAVLEITEPRDISQKPEETESKSKKIEVPVEHKDGTYKLIHTEESRHLLDDRAFESVSPDMQNNVNLFETLPETFWFSSGAGGWSTDITINPDGTFTGMHHDSDMGDTGDKYPNGTIYICSFNGSGDYRHQ